MDISNAYDKFILERAAIGDNEFRYNLNDRILIIDGLNTFIRSFLAVPTVNYRGLHVGGIVGFIRSISNGIKLFNPTRCIITFDGMDCAYRRQQIYPEYKAQKKNKIRLNRFVSLDPMLGEDESFKSQFIRLEQYLNTLPITAFMLNHVEADDLIGYMCTSIFKDSNITIYSTDRDFFQLINDRIQVYSPTKKKLYTQSEILNEFGILASNYLTYRSLTGDVSDNIPGLKGMGLKTLISRFPNVVSDVVSCNDILQYCKSAIENKSKYKIYSDILNNQQQLMLNEELMQLHDVSISGVQKMEIQNWCSSIPSHFDNMNFKRLYAEDGLQAYNDSFIYNLNQTFNQLNYHVITNQKPVEVINK